MRAFTNARIILRERILAGTVLVDGGRVVDVAGGPPPDGVEAVDLGGRYLAPGFVDIHVHGGGGRSLMTDDPEEVRAYARWVVSRGVTSFLISTAASDPAALLARLRGCAPAIGPVEPLGFHLEGPWINPARKGAFDERWLRLPAAAEFEDAWAAASGQVRQVTLAPELPAADALIAAVRRAGAVAAMGHTDATYEEATLAIARGCRHVTHCFNAMRPFAHRDPGVLGAIVTNAGVTVELIGDGEHVHPAAARMLLRAKGPDYVALITDGLPIAGLDVQDTVFEGVTVRVSGAKAVRADGTIVGSVATMDQVVRNAMSWLELSLPAAVAMATATPARIIGADGRKGAIAPGRDADFAVLDDGLRVVATYVAGEQVYAAEGTGASR